MKSRLFFIELIKRLTLPVALARIWLHEIWFVSRSWLSKRLRGPSSEKDIRVFNLDLHIAVIQDMTAYFAEAQTKLTRFSLSIHNHLQRSAFLWAPDPVAVVNQSTWKKLDPLQIQKFQKRYERFLKTFDGFVVTYPTAFFELFASTNKPILAVAATRYEAPYTKSESQWEELNNSLVAAVGSGQVTFVANNAGDADYIKFFTGLSVPVLPSLCGGKQPWTGYSGRRVTMAKDFRLRSFVTDRTNGLYQPIESLGSPYKWTELMNCLEVLVIPQNISTMTLFELATAGMPVVVPGRELLRQMKTQYSGVLDELTFAEAYGVEADGKFGAPGSPANWRDKGHLDWWLDRSDFFDRSLMPNVRVAETYEDLILSDGEVLDLRAKAAPAIELRNTQIRARWEKFVKGWADSLRKEAAE